MKNSIELFYNHPYTTYFQTIFPTLLKCGCNKKTGIHVDNGMIIANVLTLFNRQFPLAHYFTTSLIYSSLSSLGYSNHTTVYAAKMIYNLIYGCKYYTQSNTAGGHYQYTCEFADFKSSILFDFTSFVIALTGFRMILGESYPAQILVSFLSKYAVCYIAEKFSEDKQTNKYILSATALDTITEFAMPIDRISPLKEYMPEFMHSLHQQVVSFTDSGLKIA